MITETAPPRSTRVTPTRAFPASVRQPTGKPCADTRGQLFPANNGREKDEGERFEFACDFEPGLWLE